MRSMNRLPSTSKSSAPSPWSMQIRLKSAKLCAPGARCCCSSSKISRDLEPATHNGTSTFVTYTVREADEMEERRRHWEIVRRASCGDWLSALGRSKIIQRERMKPAKDRV